MTGVPVPIDDADFTEPERRDPTPRRPERLRQDLAQALGCTPGEADDWLAEHGPVAGERRIQAYWLRGDGDE